MNKNLSEQLKEIEIKKKVHINKRFPLSWNKALMSLSGGMFLGSGINIIRTSFEDPRHLTVDSAITNWSNVAVFAGAVLIEIAREKFFKGK